LLPHVKKSSRQLVPTAILNLRQYGGYAHYFKLYYFETLLTGDVNKRAILNLKQYGCWGVNFKPTFKMLFRNFVIVTLCKQSAILNFWQ